MLIMSTYNKKRKKNSELLTICSNNKELFIFIIAITAMICIFIKLKFYSSRKSNCLYRPSSRSVVHPLRTAGFTVKWDVENIWQLPFEGVSSADFLLEGHKFHLHMRRYELGIAVYLCTYNMIPADMSLFCKLYMFDQIGHEKLIGEKEITIKKGKDFYLLERVIDSSLESQQAEFPANNTLTVSCTIASSNRLNIMKQQKSKGEQIINRFEPLSSDLENFFKAQINTDVLLKVENTDFPVHRTILQARAPELASMISDESSVKTTIVSNVSASIFGDVLYYIYTGKIKGLNSDTAVQMLAAANKFSLSELKDICLKFLRANLSEDNVFEAAVLAHENGDLVLKEEVEQYILKHVSTIIQSERWKDFCSERYKFANEILTDVLLRMKIKENENKDLI